MKTLFLMVVLFFSLSLSVSDRVRTIEKSITSANDIVPINDSLVVPYVYTKAISLNHLSVVQKKKKFFEMLLPAVLVAKTEQKLTYQEVLKLSKKETLTRIENDYIEELKAQYKAKTVHMLLSRLHGFPVSIVLAQAALESGWGTSRFFLQANNPFGIWSFSDDDERIMASSHRSGEKIFLKRFSNLEKAIEAYYITLATGPYADFRSARLKTSDPFELCSYLSIYSERGQLYVDDLVNVIRSNDLTKYDSYQISPKYIVE